MYGAIIGDIVGSPYELRANRIKTTDFPLFSAESRYTDDTVMTVAVATALLRAYCDNADFRKALVEAMQRLGRENPYAGYGGAMARWIVSPIPQPYGSYGNGAAMRVSPCGLMAVTLEEALLLGEESAKVTHDHPEAVKAARCVAAAVFLAKTGKTKEEIAAYIRDNFYPLDRTVAQIRPTYRFDVSCQGSVPEAIQCFLESESCEEAIRNAVSLGGDADTQAAIAGSIAWTYYMDPITRFDKDARWPQPYDALRREADARLPASMIETIQRFREVAIYRTGAFERIGMVHRIV